MKSTSERLDLLLEDLKSENKSTTYTYILLLLVSLFLLSILAFYIKYGYFGRLLIYVVILLGTVILYRLQLSNPLRELAEKANLPSLDTVGEKQYLVSKLGYLNCGIEVKQLRISVIKQIYFWVFPILLLVLSEVVLAPISGFTEFFWKYVLAILMGGIVWLFVFNRDLEVIEGFEDDALILARAI